MPIKFNGSVRIAIDNGTGRYVFKEREARITPARIITATRVWDRDGKRITAYRPGMVSMTVLWYEVDSERTELQDVGNFTLKGTSHE